MLSVVQCKGIGGDSGVRHLIQICNLATESKVVSWTGALNSQLQLRELRNHCVRIYPQVASLRGTLVSLHVCGKFKSSQVHHVTMITVSNTFSTCLRDHY